ncbi:hypothetical protein EW146_g8189 [Bondarzewia mesenterica]|uniref:Uncharacterized protein n=1 Tax=Bondarzewia mesenterica TaxID=1095465 RepID=A0A4S4LGL2_9AGAM|nr:hypothetical protein EW146_g8189 [Bondarzewia mesenterica]
MPAHPLLIAKLKEVLSDHMKSLPGPPAELEDYVAWGKMFVGYLNRLEMLDGFMPDADITKWVAEVSASLEPVAVREWLEWGARILPQLSALVTREHEVAAEWEKVRVQQEQVTAAKAKEEEWLAHRKVREAEKLAWLMADKISPDDFEQNSDDDLMSLDLANLGEFDADTEITAPTSETRGDVSAASNAGKGKGRAEKCKTTEVSVSDPAVIAKRPKGATRDLKVIPEGAVLVNDTCYRCANEFHFMYACYRLPGADRCTKCTQNKKRCSLSTEAARSAIPTIKVELAEKKGFSSSTPRPKPTAHSSGSSMTITAAFLKKLVAEREKLASVVAASVEPGMSLPGLINAEDMITWHMESNTRELAIVLAECEADKHELEKLVEVGKGDGLASEVGDDTEGSNRAIINRAIKFAEDISTTAVSRDNHEWTSIARSHLAVEGLLNRTISHKDERAGFRPMEDVMDSDVNPEELTLETRDQEWWADEAGQSGEEDEDGELFTDELDDDL